MRKQRMLASTILLSSCAMVHTTTLGPTLILKPQIQAGVYSTKTVVNPYTQASINHLILKLYTYDGAEHDQGIQKTLLNAQIDNPITFSNLKTNTTYRIKASAYLTADESQLISTTDANSYTDVPLTNDDRPTIASLKVRLLDQAFNGQGTGSLQIINGGYSPLGSESLNIPRVVSTLAGGGGANYGGYADGLGTASTFFTPYGVAVDGIGNIYVGDNGNNLIRKITSNGVVSTLAGNTTAGYADGTGTAATFFAPFGVAVDGAGNIYVADSNNNLIRKITSNGVVSTLAGNITAGYADGAGTTAMFNSPRGIAVDCSGNVYVTDQANYLVRKITSGGVVSTLAGRLNTAGCLDGTGTAAIFSGLVGIAVDGAGNAYVGDRDNSRIRKISSGGIVTTLAGSSFGYADGPGTSAKFATPRGVAADGLGNLYVAEYDNHCIRKITSNGLVSTLAGQAGTPGYADGTGTSAIFNNPWGIAVDGSGNVYVADSGNHLIRVLK